MQVFTTVQQIQSYLAEKQNQGRTIAFVPTLGALHEGHLTLMRYGLKMADLLVASIFVNPTQFNDPKDLEKYPRPLTHDIHLLSGIGVQVLFLPTDEEVYPPELDPTVRIDLSHLTNVLEGPTRPGHFEGVITVVKRLLDIVQPHYLIMGQKDYQQQLIIGELIEQLQIPTKLIVHPTLRDTDGLALSSRNLRLDPVLRPSASVLYKALSLAKELMTHESPAKVTARCRDLILKKGITLEYFAIVDGISLQTVTDWESHQKIVACVAAWLGQVRLIDNEILK